MTDDDVTIAGAAPGHPRGRTVVVTGAARGIGHATACRLVAEGWRVVLADLGPDVLDAAHALDPSGQYATGVVADVSRTQDAQRLAAVAASAYDGAGALVANAAVGGPETALLDITDAEIRRVLDINFFGVLNCVRALRAQLERGPRPGRIVVLASLFAQVATPGAGAYSASKAASHSLMRTLSVEMAPRCTVNAVAPGYIMTAMHREEIDNRARRNGRTFDEERAALAATVPLGRHGTGEDVADAIHYLLDRADYITGHTVNVNGGVYTS
ncbi:SDR family NAD(P)-dependent oxidoreductase [Streptomyces rugosispiralis]|uniref:SDR family oxidoreductase n=1 Tax=Streptomyces rugosispiralis TaxID=2967341 RepID=A0ABT1V960_9ACTN|nr:SDR family oxidoreductase [Streptomyces rugosispiralis]MCQ8193938.1 SDR family oxidoreductase [Streptomyces rugosispiralis]